MQPILISLGSLSISSFGFFLMLGFLAAAFVCWRLAKTYDLNEEKVLDLVIMTFLGGLVGARLYFAVTHWDAFGDLFKVIDLRNYSGLSFWGGILGGALALKFFVGRTKLNFWQMADFAAIGLILGLVFGDLGCFLGGCGYGIISNLPISVSVVGVLGKRFPISLVESLLLLLTFSYLWRQAIRFHFGGKIISQTLIFLGIIKFGAEYFRGDSQMLPYLPGVYYGSLWATLLFVSGIAVFYYRSRRSFLDDLRGVGQAVISPKKRGIMLLKISKSCYNHKVGLKLQIKKIGAIRRKLNVKPTPTKLSQD